MDQSLSKINRKSLEHRTHMQKHSVWRPIVQLREVDINNPVTVRKSSFFNRKISIFY